MREAFSRQRKLTTEADAYGRAAVLASEIIELNVLPYGGVGNAIKAISRKYDLSAAWLRRLWDRNPATITLDRYERLLTALDDVCARQEAEIAARQARLDALRGRDAASPAFHPAISERSAVGAPASSDLT